MASVTALVGIVAASIALATRSVTNTVAAHSSHATFTKAVARVPAAKARVVRVTGEDFSFNAPDIVPAGLTEFRFLNKGPALHHLAILKLGGVVKANTYTKYYLAFFDQYDWEHVPAIPPEMILIPKVSPFHIYDMSSWSRTMVMSISTDAMLPSARTMRCSRL